jgi:hypothetical protein
LPVTPLQTNGLPPQSVPAHAQLGLVLPHGLAAHANV